MNNTINYYNYQVQFYIAINIKIITYNRSIAIIYCNIAQINLLNYLLHLLILYKIKNICIYVLQLSIAFVNIITTTKQKAAGTYQVNRRHQSKER